MVCFSADTSQNTKKKSGTAETAKGRKTAKSSKVSEPQLLPLIQSLERETEPPSSCRLPANSEFENDGIHTVPFEIDSEDSSLDSLPSIGLKSRVLKKMDKIASITNSDLHYSPKKKSQTLKSSQSNVASDSNRDSCLQNNVKTMEKPTLCNKDFNSNFTVPKSVPRTDSQDTNSQESSQNSIQSLSSVSSVASLQSLPKPDFVLRPGEYNIVLCVDNAEYYGAYVSVLRCMDSLSGEATLLFNFC